jgi:hypothetical protein
MFADYRTDTCTLIHIFKPIHTQIDNPVQTYIYWLIQSYTYLALRIHSLPIKVGLVQIHWYIYFSWPVSFSWLSNFSIFFVLLWFFAYFCLFPVCFRFRFFWISTFPILFHIASIFSLHFAYFPFIFASDFWGNGDETTCSRTTGGIILKFGSHSSCVEFNINQ